MRRTLALILVLLLSLSLFVGCDQAEEDPATGTPTSTPAPTSTDDGEPGALPVIEGGEFKLPLVDEPITFTQWQSADPGQSGLESLGDSLAYQEMEKLTGVKWEFYSVSSASASETFQIAMAGNEYDDFYISVGSFLVNGADWYIDNEIFVDIEPLIPQYAPNYDYVRRLTEGTYVTTITDSGKAPGFYQIVQTLQWAWMGPMGRQDWLDNLGLEVPNTYDTYHDALVAIRDEYNPERPLAISQTGCVDWLMVGMDTTYNPQPASQTANFLNIDGTAVSGLTQPGFREYVEMMTQWYSEGLIDPYFYSRENVIDSAPLLNGEVGIQTGLYCDMDNQDPNAHALGNTEFAYRGFYTPTRNAGDVRKIVMGGASTSYNKFVLSCISTSCENIEVMMRWIDYLYTEEGALLANYGLEGISFEYDEEGNPNVTDVIYRNENGLASYLQWNVYMMGLVMPSWYDWEREIMPTASDAVWETEELFDGNWEDEYTMPTLSLTQEESAQLSAIMADINTRVSETLVRIISGQMPMSEFDNMLAEVEGIGLSDAVAIVQAALDRYLARE